VSADWGEVVEVDVAGYRYYPGRGPLLARLAAEGLRIVEEGFRPEDGWGYRRYLLRDA
jgi:hypothetical protein